MFYRFLKTTGFVLLWLLLAAAATAAFAYWKASSVPRGDIKAIERHIANKLARAVVKKKLGCAAFALRLRKAPNKPAPPAKTARCIAPFAPTNSCSAVVTFAPREDLRFMADKNEAVYMKTKVLLLTLAILFCNQSFGQNIASGRLFTPAQLNQDLDFLFSELEKIHPNLYAYTPKDRIGALIQNVRADIKTPMTRLAFAQKVIPVVTALGDGHTSLLFPHQERSDYLEYGGKIFPFDVRISEGRIFVRKNYSAESELAVNTEILSINGVLSSTLLAEMRKFVSGELEFYRDTRIEGDFRRFLWFVYGWGEAFDLLVAKNGTELPKKISGLDLKSFNKAVAAQNQPAANTPFSFYQLDNGIGVLDFRHMEQRKRFDKFLDSVFTVASQSRLHTLVIDIRKNGGGSSRLADALFDYITDKPYKMAEQMDIKSSSAAKKSLKKKYLKWYLYPLVYPAGLFIRQARPYLYSRNGKTTVIRQAKLQKPKNKKLKFKGKTFLLTGNYTFSSAHMLAVAYKCYSMGTIVGEETGGTYAPFGDLIGFDLPNTKLNAFCSHKRFVHPCHDGKVHGVKPDIEIKPDLTDIENRRDAAMEYIKAKAGGKN